MNYEQIILHFLNSSYDIYPEEINGKNCLSVKFEIENKDVVLTHFCIPEITELPRFYLRDTGEYGLLAHVLPNTNRSFGSICVNASEAVSVNFQRPELAFEESLKRHIRLLTRVMGDPDWNRKELIREFKPNWDMITPVSNQKLICSSKSNVLEKMQIFEPAKGQPVGILSCLVGISDSNSDLNCLSYLKGTDKRKKAEGSGYIIPLDSLEPAPQNGENLPDWYLNAIRKIPEKLQNEFQRQFTQFRAKQFWLVFNAPTPSGVTWFGLHLTSSKKDVLPLKKERLDGWKIKRLRVDVLNKELIMPRSGANPSLDQKKVLLIGCGSVGSELAMKLGSAGLGEIFLIDPDYFSSSNIYRHALNKNFIDAPKALALSITLSSFFPWLKADDNMGNLLALRDYINILNNYDLIIIAIGSPTHERLFHEFLISKKITTPVINTWLEGYGIGGHATLDIPGSKGCLGCAYIKNDTGVPGLSSNLNFFEQDQNIVKNYAGCGETFIPYGAIHSTQTALIAADLAIRYLEGKLKTSQKVSWKGLCDDAHKYDIKLSSRYTFFQESLVPTSLYNPLCKECRGGPSVTYVGNEYKVHISKDIEEKWRDYRQVEPNSVESAGLIIGHRESENIIWIDGITTPKDTDINERTYYKLDDQAHQADIDKVFAESLQRRGYLGTWHTHPQDNPNPSVIDADDWVEHVKDNTDRPLFFIIIGRKSTKVFMLKSGPLIELRVLH